MLTTPFSPITKEQAAQILAVSVRTIDYYVRDGRMPAPIHLGRRAYWHPDLFFAWLDQALREPVDNMTECGQTGPISVSPSVGGIAASETLQPAAKRRPLVRQGKDKKVSANRSSPATAVRARDAALLARLSDGAGGE
ncbi:helix-turn-helix transcriptional regulator [Paraburkholderia sp. NPDC080076]|uniref:helix-turn-helix transcriptional regulator n=1 Tax=Paraburkholderia sp. NPDC080076 TaxID=3390605 RepID=UPI003D00C33F